MGDVIPYTLPCHINGCLEPTELATYRPVDGDYRSWAATCPGHDVCHVDGFEIESASKAWHGHVDEGVAKAASEPQGCTPQRRRGRPRTITAADQLQLHSKPESGIRSAKQYKRYVGKIRTRQHRARLRGDKGNEKEEVAAFFRLCAVVKPATKTTLDSQVLQSAREYITGLTATDVGLSNEIADLQAKNIRLRSQLQWRYTPQCVGGHKRCAYPAKAKFTHFEDDGGTLPLCGYHKTWFNPRSTSYRA